VKQLIIAALLIFSIALSRADLSSQVSIEEIMTNVGVVVYTRSESNGTLDAKWSHSTNGSGTGRLTGGSPGEFAGSYDAIYFDDHGKVKFSLDLNVQNKGDHYDLIWNMKGEGEGETVAIGIGTVVNGNLVVGYSFVDVKWLRRP
jgi:hypothetical protein